MVRGLAVIGLVLVMLAFPMSSIASADSGARTYRYIVARGCGLPPPNPFCPDVAIADNGDTVLLEGVGVLTTHPASASGVGTFVIQDPSGAILESGTWTATALLSFDSYTSPSVVGDFEGGKALIAVTLSDGSTAILTVVHVLPPPPGLIAPPGQMEGSTLNIQDVMNFHQPISGITLFVRIA